MADSSEEGWQSDIATQEAKKISKFPFHLGGKSTARMNNRWCDKHCFLQESCSLVTNLKDLHSWCIFARNKLSNTDCLREEPKMSPVKVVFVVMR
ncbi:hypothetical protein P5673_006309 [Acropora cervicornis]|uniref:Uncharacterized protein n=1 Tax=Acropora cervicornis TaxID=6130 RepID=A0AAD9VCG8_ACRCE|nr:hypothetical protein P5673_006309 [Acropora cervicornis]